MVWSNESRLVPDQATLGGAGRRRAAQGGAGRRKAAQGGTIQYPPEIPTADWSRGGIWPFDLLKYFDFFCSKIVASHEKEILNEKLNKF